MAITEYSFVVLIIEERRPYVCIERLERFSRLQAETRSWKKVERCKTLGESNFGGGSKESLKRAARLKLSLPVDICSSQC